MNALYCNLCESASFEFVECRGGMTYWQCRDCKNMEYDFNDLCSGG